MLSKCSPPPGLYQDALASWEYLLSRHDIDRRKLLVFGRSLGGAVAIRLAASLGISDKYALCMFPAFQKFYIIMYMFAYIYIYTCIYIIIIIKSCIHVQFDGFDS